MKACLGIGVVLLLAVQAATAGVDESVVLLDATSTDALNEEAIAGPFAAASFLVTLSNRPVKAEKSLLNWDYEVEDLGEDNQPASQRRDVTNAGASSSLGSTLTPTSNSSSNSSDTTTSGPDTCGTAPKGTAVTFGAPGCSLSKGTEAVPMPRDGTWVRIPHAGGNGQVLMPGKGTNATKFLRLEFAKAHIWLQRNKDGKVNFAVSDLDKLTAKGLPCEPRKPHTFSPTCFQNKLRHDIKGGLPRDDPCNQDSYAWCIKPDVAKICGCFDICSIPALFARERMSSSRAGKAIARLACPKIAKNRRIEKNPYPAYQCSQLANVLGCECTDMGDTYESSMPNRNKWQMHLRSPKYGIKCKKKRL